MCVNERIGIDRRSRPSSSRRLATRADARVSAARRRRVAVAIVDEERVDKTEVVVVASPAIGHGGGDTRDARGVWENHVESGSGLDRETNACKGYALSTLARIASRARA